MSDGLRAHLDDGEALRYEGELRTGGAVGIADDRLLVVDDEAESVPLANVAEVEVQSFDWFLGVMSALLVGFGLASVPRNAVGGALFAAAGAVSLALTYRKRGRVTVDLHAGAKPVEFYPVDTGEFRERFAEAIERFEARQAGDRA